MTGFKPDNMPDHLVTAPKGYVVIDIPDWAQKIVISFSDDGKVFNYGFYAKGDPKHTLKDA